MINLSIKHNVPFGEKNGKDWILVKVLINMQTFFIFYFLIFNFQIFFCAIINPWDPFSYPYDLESYHISTMSFCIWVEIQYCERKR